MFQIEADLHFAFLLYDVCWKGRKVDCLAVVCACIINSISCIWVMLQKEYISYVDMI